MRAKLIGGVLAAVVASLVFAGSASACCEVAFSQQATMTAYGYGYWDSRAQVDFHYPGYASTYEAAKLKERVRGYAENGRVGATDFCNSTPYRQRLCKAAKYCVAAGGIAYSQGAAQYGPGSREAIRQGINACFAAAITVFIFG